MGPCASWRRSAPGRRWRRTRVPSANSRSSTTPAACSGPPPARFRAAEIGLDAFGWNVESARLVESLRARARAQDNLTLVEADAAGAVPGEATARIALADGAAVEARLVVAADGARSPLRTASGVRVRDWTYPQSAITTILAHARPHRDVSTEFHTGPVPSPWCRCRAVTGPVWSG